MHAYTWEHKHTPLATLAAPYSLIVVCREPKTDPWQSPDGDAMVCHSFPASPSQLITPSLIPTLSRGPPVPGQVLHAVQMDSLSQQY